MKVYEVTVSKVVHRITDEFASEEEARAYAIQKKINEYHLDKSKAEYFYELTEVSDV
jgi:hypothetical protein